MFGGTWGREVLTIICVSLFRTFRAVFEDVAGLAVEGAAEGLEGGEADGAGLAGLEYREIGGGDADFCGQLAGGHLAAGEHYVYVYDYCHGICFLDSQLVLLTDSHGDSVDEGECQEYQRQEQVGIVDSEQPFGMEHDADIGVTDVVDEIDG